MLVFFAAAALLIFWVILIALVKHEHGDVGVTPAVEQRIRLRVAMRNFQQVIGETLVPAFRALTAEIVKVNKALQKIRVLS